MCFVFRIVRDELLVASDENVDVVEVVEEVVDDDCCVDVDVVCASFVVCVDVVDDCFFFGRFGVG